MKRWVYRLKRYPRVYWIFLKFGLMDIMVYRVNALLFGLAPIAWMITVLVFLSTIFSKVNLLGGWNFWEMIFLTGTHEIIFLITWCTFAINLSEFPDHVRTGKLDLALTKPINSRFLISFRWFDFKPIASALSTFLVFTVGLVKVFPEIELNRLIGFFALLIMAYWIAYFIYFIFASLSLFFVSSQYIFGWIGELTDFDRYPADIYNPPLKLFLLTVLPILFFAYVPTAYLLGKIGKEYILLALLALVVFGFLSSFIWRAGLRRYQSASS